MTVNESLSGDWLSKKEKRDGERYMVVCLLGEGMSLCMSQWERKEGCGKRYNLF